MSMVKLNVPQEILLSLNTSENAFSKYVRSFIALDLYKNKNISLGYCAKLAEMTKEDFIIFLGENKVSIFEFKDKQDFLEEMNNA
ncbi:MAG: UPF0175 family protein [Sporomusaceae bacterium]|jgi:predicted HTH domain antitoxin|nr:UPF0175 family protein [Sporomusaceae bacterium]